MNLMTAMWLATITYILGISCVILLIISAIYTMYKLCVENKAGVKR